MGYFPMFCWSDKWWIEGTTAWFVTAESNALMQYDMKDESGKVLSKIPGAQGLRWNPECTKYNDEIICFPDRGKNVWIYSLKTNKWEEIEINEKDNKRKTCQYIYREGSNIYFVSRTLGKMYILDMRTKMINEYEVKSLYEKSTGSEFKALSNGIIMGEYIIFAFAETAYILMIHRHNKKYEIRKLELETQIMRIQADKNQIWIVSLDKSLYLWNSDTNSVERISDFPKSFGGYVLQDNNKSIISLTNEKFSKPLFCVPVVFEESIWFIPWYGTEILYIEKGTLKVSSFPITDEIADACAIDMLGCRYLINYVRQKRYIGIFSSKTGCQIEIDTKEKIYKYIYMIIDRNDVKNFNPIMERNKNMLKIFLNEML